MRIGRYEDRMIAVVDGGAVDIEKVTEGAFSNDPCDVVQRWSELRGVVESAQMDPVPFDHARLQAPIPLPRQVFAIGLNYAAHAREAGVDLPESPPVFTKFPTSISGPADEVTLPSAGVDYEVELVVVIGRGGSKIQREDVWDHVAGYMVGQDLSERAVQLAGPVPQFSLGKSYRGFGPTGPVIVGIEEFDDPDDLEIGCCVGEEVLQRGRTSDLIFDVRDLVVRLSAVCSLLPGDLIFTGTPSGVGMGRAPQRFLRPGETLTSYIQSVGAIDTRLIAPADLS